MIPSRIQAFLVEQAGLELFAAQTYRQFGATCGKLGLSACQKYFNASAAEETEHANKILKYLDDRDADVVLGTIEAPSQAWTVPEMALQALNLERMFSGRFNALKAMSEQNEDGQSYAVALEFLQIQTAGEAEALLFQRRAAFASLAELELLVGG